MTLTSKWAFIFSTGIALAAFSQSAFAMELQTCPPAFPQTLDVSHWTLLQDVPAAGPGAPFSYAQIFSSKLECAYDLGGMLGPTLQIKYNNPTSVPMNKEGVQPPWAPYTIDQKSGYKCAETAQHCAFYGI
ncbi:MAG: hypothetical protein COV52_07040 [Gammaproteobacteria bacterium CG11_big_fil_rev_8_21_14_0_20_46_22]|nr:MAG: hypothetical protein COW05_06085 [Gammaproteobacteria bacterium CG12_big_fil_rev_8_21_14_0_65_46_12]PIR10794.1 MAG: hypothetical protein COV52_07040 [Gammaproteobacteria bacterium CG11_big_fil_rev_8_21_14_0_20_46_22]